MDFLQIISDRIKPELNQLYYENWRPDTIFCREHAFHIYILCRALGKVAGIQSGNFSAHVTAQRTQYSDSRSDGTNVTDGHYWNRVDQAWPVDVSISFRNWCPPSQDIGLVFEADCNGVFNVLKTLEPTLYTEIKSGRSKQKDICYYRVSDSEPDPCELLANPYSFLIQEAPPWQPLTATHGTQIFDKITLHLVKLAMGNTAPLFPKKLTFEEALSVIKKKHKNARKTLTAMIENSNKICQQAG